MRWNWIDRIIDFEAGSRLVAIKNVSRAEDHLHDHLPAHGDLPAVPVMPMSLIIEGMAQTAGLLVGSMSDYQEKVILAKVVKATLNEDVFPGDTLRYSADVDRFDSLGAATKGRIERCAHPATSWTSIGAIDLMFSHVDQNMAGLDFPDENFVFTASFRELLRASGLKGLA
jgi:3-hydroxyacyl-[acyl-carrier-protein] dehydratase